MYKNFRWLLQIRLKDSNCFELFNLWDINEPFKTRTECENMAEALLDNTVVKMRIVDTINGEVFKFIDKSNLKLKL